MIIPHDLIISCCWKDVPISTPPITSSNHITRLIHIMWYDQPYPTTINKVPSPYRNILETHPRFIIAQLVYSRSNIATVIPQPLMYFQQLHYRQFSCFHSDNSREYLSHIRTYFINNNVIHPTKITPHSYNKNSRT